MTQHIDAMELLGAHIAQEQDRELVEDVLLGAVRARLTRHGSGRSRIMRAGWVAAATFAIAAAAGVALVGIPRGATPLAARVNGVDAEVGQWVSAPESGNVPLEFSDGTRIVLQGGSKARLNTVDSDGAHLLIESGSADVAVVPRKTSHWLLSLGPFQVDVTGTHFDVAWNPTTEVLQLGMKEGKVFVSGCVLGDGRPLLAGEKLRASCRDKRFEIARTDGSVSGAASAAASVESEATGLAARDVRDARRSPAPASTSIDPEVGWQDLARAGKFREAFASASEAGLASEMQRATADELALLGDSARFSGNPSEAVRIFLALRSRFPKSRKAGEAAFLIARVHFDHQGAYAEAARWFQTYLSEQRGGPLAREALGRLMEALERSGDRAGARDAAARYLAKYPSGPHARVARQLRDGS